MPPVLHESPLLALPDTLLMTVLRCLAADAPHRYPPRNVHSLLSVARAHSRLHKAAVAALSSMRVWGVSQQHVDSALMYLAKHGQHVSSISMHGSSGEDDQGTYYVNMRHLPAMPQLRSLELSDLVLHLQAGAGFPGVFGAAGAFPALTQLRLSFCMLTNDPLMLKPFEDTSPEAQSGLGLAAALSRLPALEHLYISTTDTYYETEGGVTFPTGVLQSLQRLTYLELCGTTGSLKLQGPVESWQDSWGRAAARDALQPLSALTALRDLRLRVVEDFEGEPYFDSDTGCKSDLHIRASTLAGAVHLRHLRIDVESGYGSFEPGALAGKSQLRCLSLHGFDISGGADAKAQLLSILQQCPELAHLCIPRCPLRLTAPGQVVDGAPQQQPALP